MCHSYQTNSAHGPFSSAQEIPWGLTRARRSYARGDRYCPEKFLDLQLLRNKFPFSINSQIYRSFHQSPKVLLCPQHYNVPNIHLLVSRDVENYLWSPILIQLDIGQLSHSPSCALPNSQSTGRLNCKWGERVALKYKLLDLRWFCALRER